MLWKQFLPFTKHNGMLQAKQMTNVLFSLPSIHSTPIVFASFGNLVNVLHDYQSIHVSSPS